MSHFLLLPAWEAGCFPFGLSGRPGSHRLGGTRSLFAGKYRYCDSMQMLAVLGTDAVRHVRRRRLTLRDTSGPDRFLCSSSSFFFFLLRSPTLPVCPD